MAEPRERIVRRHPRKIGGERVDAARVALGDAPPATLLPLAITGHGQTLDMRRAVRTRGGDELGGKGQRNALVALAGHDIEPLAEADERWLTNRSPPHFRRQKPHGRT